MGNINGRFVDELPQIIAAQVITAKTTVKTDLNTVIAEANQLRATNTFLVTQQAGQTGNDAGSVAVSQVAQGTVGSAQTFGEIGGGGQPCATGVSRIEMADGGWKYIKNIRLKDEVVSFDPFTGELKTGIVTDLFQHLVPEYCLLEFDDGHTTGIDAKGVHRYWTGNDKYEPVAKLDSIKHWQDGEWTTRKIVNRRIIKGETVIYNFTVAGHHNYLLNKDAVSNRKDERAGELEVVQ